MPERRYNPPRPWTIEPRTAPDVGVRRWEDWPYGPNISGETRIAMVDWARRHNLRLSPTGQCRHWILKGRNCPVHTFAEGWEDHPTGWLLTGVPRKPAVFVAQPYPGVDVAPARAFAEAHGLRCHVAEAGGWYGHGALFVAVYNPALIASVTV